MRQRGYVVQLMDNQHSDGAVDAERLLSPTASQTRTADAEVYTRCAPNKHFPNNTRPLRFVVDGREDAAVCGVIH